MYDDDLAVTPFDPSAGIWFKYGRVYRNRNAEIAEFEQAVCYQLPSDFLEMIGEYCEGGFDGHYRVYFKNGIEVQWDHLLLIRVADEHDTIGFEDMAQAVSTNPELSKILADQTDIFDHDVLKLIRGKPKLFGKIGEIQLFPFGKACVFRSPDDITNGYLAFDALRSNAVVFVSDTGERRAIAKSFREMMLGSSFVFYG